MAPARASVTRLLSSDSSVASNINVKAAAEDSGSEQPSASTPPSSVSEGRSMQSSKSVDDNTRSPGGSANSRPKRARASVGTYNLKELSEKTLPVPPGSARKASGLSGRTLVDRDDDEEEAGATLGDTLEKALNPDGEVPAESPEGKLPARPQRKPSVKDRVKNAAGNVKSVLGKRTRDMVESGKRKLGMQAKEESPRQKKLLKELDMGPKGVLDELDLDEDYDLPMPPPAKRAKKDVKTALQEIAQPILSGPLQKTSDGKKVKKWHTSGLYVGQDADFDPEHPKPKKLQKKRPVSDVSEPAEEAPKKPKLNMTLPMFSYLEKERPFVIPYDVFAPSLKKGDEKPKDWKVVNKNRLIGDAKDQWKRQEENLPQSACVCKKPAEGELGCGEDCLNRVMQYECNAENCILPAALCGNRPFAQLGERLKKAGKYDIGVEVVKTENRGFGIRSCRSFLPGQIIMEYTGEIVDEEECQRRMRDLYKNKECYYLMEMEHNLVIDGTKGSMARFINHSCAPNCEVHMIKVNGTPRMAVFAGKDGIMTGEELTYDYNFDNFGDSQQKCYCGASTCRGTLSKRLNAAEQKKLAKLEAERKRKEQEMRQKIAEAEARKKKNKTDPTTAPGWRGWVAVDDPETKARLKEEKRLAEEKAKNSSRALRLAKRHQEQTAEPEERPASRAKSSPRRRKTVASADELTRKTSTESKATNVDEDESEEAVRQKRLRRTSTGSRFTEGLDADQRPASRQSARSSIHKKTTVSVTKSAEVQNETIEEDEDITVATAPLLSPKRKSLSRSSSKKQKEPVIPDSEDEGQENEVVAKLKRNSMLSSASKKIFKGSEKAFGSASGKWKQSTLNFSKRV